MHSLFNILRFNLDKFDYTFDLYTRLVMNIWQSFIKRDRMKKKQECLAHRIAESIRSGNTQIFE